MHKETLKEHMLLHGQVILHGTKFACPICQREVTCQSGSHQHDKNYCVTRSQAAAYQDTKANKQTLLNEVTLQNGVNTRSNEGIRLRLKSRNLKLKEAPATIEVTDNSGGVLCKICGRSFVYQKCLQKHLTLVHGLMSEDRSKSEIKADIADESDTAEQAEDSADGEQSVVNDICSQVSDRRNAVNSVSVPANMTKVSSSPAQRNSGESGQLTKWKVDPSDLTCKTCLKQFKHKAMLLRHMNMIHGETEFETCTCPLCLQKFSSQWMFSKHFDVEHSSKAAEIFENGRLNTDISDADAGVDIARCQKCTQWFSSQLLFQKHCNLKHRNDEKFTHSAELSTNAASEMDIDSQGEKPCTSKTAYENSNAFVLDDSKAEIFQSTSSSECKTGQDMSDDNLQQPSKYSCSLCSKSFVSENFLDRHIRLKHNSFSSTVPRSDEKLGGTGKVRKQTFVCGFCSAEFNKEEALVEHVESQHQSDGAESAECVCPVCGCSCPNQMLFSVHYDAAHCMTSALYDSASSLLQESVSNPVCHCKICEQWFTSEEIFRGHQCVKQTPVRQQPKTGRARYRCMQCGEAFNILRRFLYHRKVKHRVLGPDKIGHPPTTMPFTDLPADAAEANAVNGLDVSDSLQCVRGRPPKSNDALVNLNNDEENQGDLSEKQQLARVSLSQGSGLACPECQRVFSNIAQLRRHRKTEHRNRTCQLCGEICKSADMVYYHNLKYHHEQKCEVCGASCSGRLGLIDHFRVQHPNEPPPLINRKTLICEYCPRVFAGCASRLLRDHIESCHLGRVHLCDVCGKRLGSAQTLAVHRRMHDPIARFECHECNRRFPHNTNLMNHIRKHHPERLPAKYIREFRCDVCSMQFGSSSGLSRHRSEKHGSQRFQCDMCLRVFPSVTGLRVHKRRDHQPQEASLTSVPVTPVTVAVPEAVLTPPPQPPLAPQQQPPPQVVTTQFPADPTNALMAGFMANMIGLPGLAQTFQ